MNGTTFNMTKRTLANYCPYRYAVNRFSKRLTRRKSCINLILVRPNGLWYFVVRICSARMHYRRWFHEGYPLGARPSLLMETIRDEKRTSKT